MLLVFPLAAGLPAQEKSVRPFYSRVVTQPVFPDRFDHSSVSFGGKLFVLGGNGRLDWLNDVWSSVDGSSWTEVTKHAAWSARSQHESVVFLDRIWVIGGYDGSLRNDVWSSADGATWELMIENAPWSARSDFAVEVLGDRLYLFSGHEEWRRLNDVWSTTDGRTWELVTAEAPWAPRSDVQSTVHNGRIYLMGGCYFDYESWLDKYIYGHYVYFEDIWTTQNGRDWELLTKRTPLGGRILGGLISHHGWLYFIGGDDDSQTPSPSRVTWVSRDGLDWRALRLPRRENQRNIRRLQSSFTVHNDRIWIIGGVDYSFNPAILRLDGDTANPEKHFEEKTPRPKLQPFHPLYGKQLYDN